MFNGFSTWWIPYLYLWTVLWGAAMLLPTNMSKKVRPLVYMLLNAAHGFLYGTLYAPAQAVLFGLDFEKTVAWIVAGLPWDAVHGISNFICGLLIVPIITVLRLAENGMENGRK
jgi:energy-coupling factor transport system substrate-specific component